MVVYAAIPVPSRLILPNVVCLHLLPACQPIGFARALRPRERPRPYFHTRVSYSYTPYLLLEFSIWEISLWLLCDTVQSRLKS